MTDLKRAAEALYKATEHIHCARGCPLCDSLRHHREALRAALQREAPAPNAVITNCISYDRVLDKAEVEAHWEACKAELRREEPQCSSSTWGNLPEFVQKRIGLNPHEWDNKTTSEQRDYLIGIIFTKEEPKVEVPWTKPLCSIGADIFDAEHRLLASMPTSRIAEALVALANRAAPQAGRELAELILDSSELLDWYSYSTRKVRWEDIVAKAREVLGKKEPSK